MPVRWRRDALSPLPEIRRAFRLEDSDAPEGIADKGAAALARLFGYVGAGAGM